MIFSLDVRRARKGDCLLVHYGTAADPGLMLVDGGPSQVYRPQLLPRLDEIRRGRGLAASGTLPVDLLLVSHIDDDHINGILELTGDLADAHDAHRPLPLNVRTLWHNSFDDIIGNDPAHLLAAVRTRFGASALAEDAHVDGLDPDGAKVLASVGQGFRLRDDARKLRWRVNPQFESGLVMADAGGSADVELGRGLRLTVVGPRKPELRALQRDHDQFLQSGNADPSAAILAAFTDRSVPNLSSIVLLAQAGGRRMLLTGDARGDKILQGLESAEVLGDGGPLHVDILKVPHHGSDRNVSRAFFERVIADHYVLSGNGEHGNPERATFDMLRQARGETGYTVHLTYPLDEIDEARQSYWERHHDEPWSAAAQSLGAFFDAHPAMAALVRIVPPAAPHVIDVAEPLGI